MGGLVYNSKKTRYQALDLYDFENKVTNWPKDNKYEWSYDSDGNELSETGYSWSPYLQDWIGEYREEWTYDGDGNLLSYIEYFWSSYAQDWGKNEAAIYYYSNSGTTSIKDITSHISICPNPADDLIILQMESNDYSSLVIRNITGQIVMHEDINNTQMQLDVSALESGLYLIEIQGKGKAITQKIVIR